MDLTLLAIVKPIWLIFLCVYDHTKERERGIYLDHIVACAKVITTTTEMITTNWALSLLTYNNLKLAG